MRLSVFYFSPSEQTKCADMLRNAGWMDLRPEGFARRFAKGDERIMFLESGFLVHVGVEDDESWMDPILDTYLEGEHWFFPLASSDSRDVFEALAEHMPKLLKPYSDPVTRGYVSSADLVRFERRSERWIDAIFELQGLYGGKYRSDALDRLYARWDADRHQLAEAAEMGDKTFSYRITVIGLVISVLDVMQATLAFVEAGWHAGLISLLVGLTVLYAFMRLLHLGPRRGK